jgi:hypothetical protein
MATMDIIKHHGGEPANFLDCGGGVTEAMVGEGPQQAAVGMQFWQGHGGAGDRAASEGCP